MLELMHLQKKYGTGLVVDIPHFVLEKGIYWLKGVNGSGKTTLLKMVAGLLPFDGDIQLNAVSSKKDGVAYRRLVSWSEAEPLYPSFMSGSNLVDLYRNIKKTTKEEVANLIGRLGMNSYIYQPIGTYSAGMVKKLSLLLAFMGNASLIILDEPLITLDAEAVEIIADMIFEKSKEQGSSFLMSSHQELQDEVAVVGKVITINNANITAV